MAVISSGIFAGSMLSAVIAKGVLAAGAVASTAMTAKNAYDQKKEAKRTRRAIAKQAEQNQPVYNEKKEMKKAGDMAAEQNRRRVMTETDTIKTSALGNTGTTNVQKKTLLGG